MIIVKNLTKKYNSSKDKTEEVIALNDISLVLPDKGFIAIYGASGSINFLAFIISSLVCCY